MAQSLREDAHPTAEGWSNWVRAMVPAKKPKEMVGQHYELRGAGQEGVMCTNIRTTLHDEMKKCGIYEWKAVKGTPHKVVYVGSTCRGKPRSLRARVLEYCTSGSHKEDFINDALEKGYELHVRVKTSGGSKVDAEKMENELLEQYDYAWNVRNNGNIIRVILN